VLLAQELWHQLDSVSRHFLTRNRIFFFFIFCISSVSVSSQQETNYGQASTSKMQFTCSTKTVWFYSPMQFQILILVASSCWKPNHVSVSNECTSISKMQFTCSTKKVQFSNTMQVQIWMLTQSNLSELIVWFCSLQCYVKFEFKQERNVGK
jgi:hypothetical protein